MWLGSRWKPPRDYFREGPTRSSILDRSKEGNENCRNSDRDRYVHQPFHGLIFAFGIEIDFLCCLLGSKDECIFSQGQQTKQEDRQCLLCNDKNLLLPLSRHLEPVCLEPAGFSYSHGREVDREELQNRSRFGLQLNRRSESPRFRKLLPFLVSRKKSAAV